MKSKTPLKNSRNTYVKFNVLMYHSIDSDQHPIETISKEDMLYVVDIADFKKQISYLADLQIPVVTLQTNSNHSELSEYNSDRMPVIITFDDGHITNYTLALPVLKQFGFRGYFFITTDWINQQYYMNEEMLRELHDCGMVIGSHGISHKFLSDLTEKEIDYELKASKSRLEDITGSKVSAFSAPGGRLDKRVIDLAKNIGYSYIFGSEPVTNILLDGNSALGRFAMKRKYHFTEYTKLVTSGPSFVDYLKFKVLKSAKLLMGNRNYQNVRSIIKSIKSGSKIFML